MTMTMTMTTNTKRKLRLIPAGALSCDVLSNSFPFTGDDRNTYYPL